ncbi:MAG: reverse transcriptase family protein [Candidatus Thiodiazotropha endolucinida]|nr:reverse transcriptase family protein [Candidatus Thiodiazotropha endolucinida]
MATCNIEGAISNKAYLQKLCSENQITCIQEHWLWEFQKDWLNENLENYHVFARCHDSNENISNFNVPRGRAGVAIIWQDSIADNVTKLDVGNERVIAVEINADIKVCIINVYMPTNKSESEYGYRECLDTIHDILQRFDPTHTIVLCGDLNGTLLPSRNNKHDVMLKDFVDEHRLLSGKNCGQNPTFYHFNGTVTSQIDYILCSEPNIFKSYIIMDRQPENLSPHVPVKAELAVFMSSKPTRSSKNVQSTPKTVYSWNKIDKDKFSLEIAQHISKCSTGDVNSDITSVMNCLKLAAQKAVPSKKSKLKGPRKRASREVLERLRAVKSTYRKWVSAGKPHDGHLYMENKLAKKYLRQQQRTEETISRKNFYQNLMENPSTDMFYRLIRKSKSRKESATTCIVVNNQKNFDISEQRHCFAQYYEDLATPKDNDYDDVYLKLCNIRCDNIHEQCLNSGEMLTFSEADVEKAMNQLNNGKSADEYGLSAEHFKAGKRELTPVITNIFNKILCDKEIPPTFKTGLITPVLKKGKDSKLLENYRGITVTSTFGKLFEYTLLSKLDYTQSDMQFGFTEGLSPMMASLLISEAKAESNERNSTVLMATLDSCKAFDVVDHSILLDKLFEKDINDASWLVIKDLYQDISSKVKWFGGLSDSFPINQGVRQGGILSTHLYKVYIDELLHILRSKRLGLKIGTTHIGNPTCADDVALLASSAEELQLMLQEAVRFARKNRYRIHPTKTCISLLSKLKIDKNSTWKLGESTVGLSDSSLHLGVTRAAKKESELNVKDRITAARRTSYSLMNTGLHGSNGLNPKTSYIIYKAYVLPRLLYGLEVLNLTKGQLDQLSKYHIRTLRNIQSLPQRTSTSAVLMLLGALPLEAELHKRRLSLVYSVISNENHSLKSLIQRQLACAFNNKDSFFYEISQILQKYDLPSLFELICSDLSKLQWKTMCKHAINAFWTKQLACDIKTKKSLKLLPLRNLRIGLTHLVWRNVETSVADVKKAIVKARVLTGTYILQKQRQSFSNGSVDPVCRHCRLGEEDLLHVVSRCPAFFSTRQSTIKSLSDIISVHVSPDAWKVYFNDWNLILKTLVCAESVLRTFPELKDSVDSIEKLSRDFFYKIHNRKLQLENQRG